MSIARAFTTRKVRQGLEGDSVPHRSHTTKNSGSIRHKISAPVELIFTTNQLSYNAPDIFPKTYRSASTGSSTRSDDDLFDTATNASSPPTSPDLDSPKRSLSPEPNHLSCYFTPPAQSQSPAPLVAALAPAPAPAQSPAASSPSRRPPPPMIPERAASHAKKPYDGLVRQRSSSRMSEQSQQTLSSKESFSFSRSSSASTTATSSSQYSAPPQHKVKVSGSFVNSSLSTVSSGTHRSSASQSSQASRGHKTDFSQAQHPFGLELAQVSEIAEEYGVKERLNELETEEKELVAKGLNKFTAEDYLGEINSLISSFFTDVHPMAPAALWI